MYVCMYVCIYSTQDSVRAVSASQEAPSPPRACRITSYMQCVYEIKCTSYVPLCIIHVFYNTRILCISNAPFYIIKVLYVFYIIKASRIFKYSPSPSQRGRHTHPNTRTHTYIHTHTYTHMRVYPHACVHTHVYTHVHTKCVCV
jgi:hypothetical protein